MKQLWLKVSDALVLIMCLAFVFLFIIALIPAIPFILVYAYFSDKQSEKEYNRFLERMNGACFFCYNSRKSSVEFARDVIVPELAASVRVVYVDGSKVVAGTESGYISKMLYRITERKGFPYLLKINNKQILELSVNNQFYSIMIGRKPTAPLLDRINYFFEYATLD